MAITIPIISEFADKGLKSAEAAFNHFRNKVGEAEGAMGKFKAGSGAALDYVKANAGTFALGAGAALATFGAKAVMAFQDTALAAGKFSDATGLATEDASRWIEVAGDIGVEAGSVQGALNKLNKAVESGSKAFDEMGAAIVRTEDGSVDVNKTFLNVVDALNRIPDPAKRAQLASDVLGKSWMDLSELIAQGSTQLTKSLSEVSDAKIIDEDEVRKAREFRERMDELSDTFQNIALEVGEALVPVLEKTLDVLNPILKGLNLLFPDDLLKDVTKFAEAQQELNRQLEASWKGYYRARINAEDLDAEINTLDGNVNGLIDTWDTLLGKLSEEEAFRNVEESFDRVYEAAGRALEEKTPAAARAAQDAVADLYKEVADYIVLLGNIPAEKQTEILAMLDKGQYEIVRRELDRLANPRYVEYIPIRPGDTPSETTGRGTRKRSSRADIFGPAQEGPNLLSSTMAGTYGSVTVNVMGSVTSEKDLVETIRRGLVSSQRNGAQLVYSNV